MKTIALVDDNKDMADLLETVTRDHDIKATFISSSLEALQYLTDNEVDVAIIDLQMPYMDGLRLVKEITKNQDGKNMPHPTFVCYTARTVDDELRRMVTNAGFSKIFTKPFHIGDILDEVGCFA